MMPQLDIIHIVFVICVFAFVSVLATLYNAKLIDYGVGQRLWYVVLPSSADAPYEIEAINGEGAKVASRSFDDSRDLASVLMSK